MALRCEPCNMVFTGTIPYGAHITSLKHEKNVENFQNTEVHSGKLTQSILDNYIKKKQNEYICVSCNITLNSIQQAESHVHGQKHRHLAQKMAPLPHEDHASDVSNYEQNTSEKSLKFPFTFKFHDITMENVLSDITVFDVNDPVHF